MKKFLLLFGLMALGHFLIAQDLKKVQTVYLLNKMEDAKTEIDKVMGDAKQANSIEALYWKSKVYAALLKDKTLRAKYPSAFKESDEAFQKYSQLDPKFILIADKDKGQGAQGVFDIYGASFDEGVQFFNAKNWVDAAHYFKLAVTYSDYIFSNKWTSSTMPFDTTSILYLGYAYQNAQKVNEAVATYARLAEKKVAGDNYLDIYRYLGEHYIKTKDESNFNKYLSIAKSLYPKFPWDELEIDYMDQNMSLVEKTELFNKEDAAGTLTERKYLLFGDIFVNAHHKDKTMDSIAERTYNQKAADAFKKAFQLNNQNGVAAFNVGVIYYNFYGEIDDKYAANIRAMQAVNANKATTPAAIAANKAKVDAIKKENGLLEKSILENLDISLEWLEKAFNNLKDKSNKTKPEITVLNKSVDFLANIFAYKRDKSRGKDQKAFDQFEAKYKVYDALHAKF